MNYWEGKKIRLRGIEPEDYEHFYQWNLETETARNLAWLWFPTSRESQRAWAAAESLKKGINDEYFFVIETLSGEFVGSIHSNTVSRIDGSFRYGIGIVERARGQGFAKEAIRLFLGYYFNELRYHKVNVTIYAFNHNSIQLHKHLGFIKEGQLRAVKYTQGRHWDALLYGMTRAEFNQHL